MQIRITDAAEGEIEKRLGQGGFTLQLVYDTEGCGCAVSGIAALWAVPSETPDGVMLLQADSSSIPLVYEKRHEVFFDDVMTLDFSPKTQGFILKSDWQIFNTYMNLDDKRRRPEGAHVYY